jgi:hypothetical protein
LASNADTALDAARAFLLARQCAYYAKLGAPSWQMADVLAVREALGELRAIELNTWERSEKIRSRKSGRLWAHLPARRRL